MEMENDDENKKLSKKKGKKDKINENVRIQWFKQCLLLVIRERIWIIPKRYRIRPITPAKCESLSKWKCYSRYD